MDQISPFLKQSSNLHVNLPPFELHIANTKKNLDCFYVCLEKGIMPIYKRSVVEAEKFSGASEEILKHLLQRGEQTGIDIVTDQFTLTLKETHDAVSISLQMGAYKVTRTLTHTSLIELQGKLLRDIVCYFNAYPKEAITMALDHILFDAPDDNVALAIDAVLYIVNCSDDSISPDLKLAAAAHIFLYDQEYPEHTFERLVTTIICHHQDSHPSLHDLAEKILSDPRAHSDAVIRGALVFLLNFPDDKTSPKLKFDAVTHVFQHNQNFSSDIISGLAKMIIRNSRNCQKKTLVDATKYIFINSKKYSSESIRSAAIYIAYNAADFPVRFFIAAANDIVKNRANYPGIVLKQAAHNFILLNENFFKAPAISQRKFVAFFENINKNDVLHDYSNKLIAALCSDDRLFKVREWAEQAEQFIVVQKVSILALWNSHKFHLALEANEKVAIFLLKNMQHEALTLWGAHYICIDET